MERYKILEGLPPYGDVPQQFSATGMGTYREGFVVQFSPNTTPVWVGNFQRGMGSLEGVFNHPNQELLVVVAAGQAYVIEVHNRELRQTFGGMLETVFEIPEQELLVFGDRTEFQAFGRSGRIWQSHRISWDGFYSLAVDGDELVGEAWSYEDIWLPFRLNLRSGQHQGGAL
jgi:hypothetical protein